MFPSVKAAVLLHPFIRPFLDTVSRRTKRLLRSRVLQHIVESLRKRLSRLPDNNRLHCATQGDGKSLVEAFG